MSKRKVIAIAVGGTGGHVIPAQEIAKRFSHPDHLIYVGVGLKKNQFFRKCCWQVFDVDGGNFSKGLFRGLKKICKGFLQARKILKKEGVTHVVGWGSYHSLPLLMAAKYWNIPYVLVETNIIPGKVNRFFSKWACNNYISFAQTASKIRGQTALIDFTFKKASREISQEAALKFFGLETNRETIFVFGGSQGAKVLNQTVSKAITEEMQIIHFTGNEREKYRELYEKLGVKAFVTNFSHEIDLAWQAADLVVCRSGAGALREMLQFYKPAILVPYPYASDNHQEKNAWFMEEIGGGICLLEKDLHPKKLRELFLHKEKFSKMKENLKQYQSDVERKDLLLHIREFMYSH